MFDDGYAYNVVLTVNATNKLGGTAADWNNGGLLGNDGEIGLNPLSLVAKYDIAKVADTQGTNHTLQFVTNHNVKNETNYDNFQVGQDVGLYTWAEAMRLFGYDVDDNSAPQKNPSLNWSIPIPGTSWSKLKDDNKYGKLNSPKYRTIGGEEYYMPTAKEMTAILPFSPLGSDGFKAIQNTASKNSSLNLVSFTNDWASVLSTPVRKLGKVNGNSELLGEVVIGNEILRVTDYDDEYITKQVGNSYITYAKRFIGTKYESAWRYEYKKDDLVNGGNHLIVKNVMLGKNSSKSLVTDIADDVFFAQNNSVERIFPAYGYISLRYNEFTGIAATSIRNLNVWGTCWLNTLMDVQSALNFSFNTSQAITDNFNFRTYGFTVRPFKKH